MIYDNIKNLKKYNSLHKNFYLVEEFINNNDLKLLECQKYPIKNDDVYVIIQEYLTKDENSSLLEAHKKYIDIQYVIQGEEKIGIAMLSSTLEATEYSQERDIIFLNGKHEYINANSKNFFIFFPQDAHKPSISIDKTSSVKKAVFKIKI